MQMDTRKDERRKYGDYMRVTDNSTEELIGYLTEISLGGFRLESPKTLTVEKDYTLRLEYTSEVKDKPYIVFVVRA
jgi:hypothetical protein